MNSRICEYVSGRTEPYFFSKPDDAALEDIHKEIQRSIETATEVMTFEIDLALMLRAQAVLAGFGWTLEEACILYLYWLIECPEAAAAWDKACEDRKQKACTASQETSAESSKEGE